uniref:Ig-like domain-containing protein n=1 Tax=Cyanoderma ruficeps TaxID=181631 RepID=A0A8C3QJ22_9PASS
MGGCDTELSPGSLSRPIRDCPRALSHRKCCPHGDSSGTAPHPAPPGSSQCRGTLFVELGAPGGLGVTQWGGPEMPGVTGPPCSPDWLVLQVPAWPLLEGDRMTLRCRRWKDMWVTKVLFYREKMQVRGLLRGTELSLSPLQLNHSGDYHCEGQMKYSFSEWQESALVTVTVNELFTVPVLEGPSELTEGSPLNLSCLSTPSPLRPRTRLLYLFYRDGQSVRGPKGSPQFLLPTVGVSHSGDYSCQVHTDGGTVWKSSARLRVTVRSECGDGHGEPPQPHRVPPRLLHRVPPSLPPDPPPIPGPTPCPPIPPWIPRR